MTPALCTLLATSVTEVRLTPNISARNSCVRATVSLAARYAHCSSQRQNRASIECSALQEVVTRACDNSTSLYRIERLRSGSLVAAMVRKWVAGILLHAIGICTTTRTSDL